jgi:Na+-translocating ferredoxin:NAD+ oxidoreductase RnfD subunit
MTLHKSTRLKQLPSSKYQDFFMLEKAYQLKETMYPTTKVNKVLLVQVIIVHIWTKHIQYHMQMAVVQTLHSVIAVIS